MEKSIHYLRNQEIDRTLWDRCVQKSPHARIYALSWYLDACTDQWDTLIFGDYEAVMPLPFRKKFGIVPYIYLPFLCQQLGVFTSSIDAPPIRHWIEAIPGRYKFIDYLLHSGTEPVESFQHLPNYLLDLSGSYSELKSAFNQNRRRELNKANKAGLRMEPIQNIPLFIQMVEAHSDHYSYERGWKDKLTTLIREGFKRELVQLAVVKSSENEILQLLLFAIFRDRLYYLVPVAVNPRARETGAATFQVDRLIQMYGEKLHYFDFEGSKIPGVARFFESFGAKPNNYWHYKKRSII